MCLPKEPSEGTTNGMQNPICHPKFAFGPRSNGIRTNNIKEVKYSMSVEYCIQITKYFPLNIQITKSRKMQMQPKKL